MLLIQIEPLTQKICKSEVLSGISIKFAVGRPDFVQKRLRSAVYVQRTIHSAELFHFVFLRLGLYLFHKKKCTVYKTENYHKGEENSPKTIRSLSERPPLNKQPNNIVLTVAQEDKLHLPVCPNSLILRIHVWAIEFRKSALQTFFHPLRETVAQNC